MRFLPGAREWKRMESKEARVTVRWPVVVTAPTTYKECRRSSTDVKALGVRSQDDEYTRARTRKCNIGTNNGAGEAKQLRMEPVPESASGWSRAHCLPRTTSRTTSATQARSSFHALHLHEVT